MIGDVIFVEGNGIVSYLIKKVTKGKFSHVAFYISDTLILEAEWNTRCRIIDINETDYLQKNHSIIHVPLTDHQKNMLHVVIYQFLGKRYDFRLIFKLLLKYIFNITLKKDSPNEVICSELIGHLLISLCVIDYSEFDVTVASPSELYDRLYDKFGGD